MLLKTGPFGLSRVLIWLGPLPLASINQVGIIIRNSIITLTNTHTSLQQNFMRKAISFLNELKIFVWPVCLCRAKYEHTTTATNPLGGTMYNGCILQWLSKIKPTPSQ